jgi:hypothetical protein
MSAKLVEITQRTPKSISAQGACSRDDPQPKLVRSQAIGRFGERAPEVGLERRRQVELADAMLEGDLDGADLARPPIRASKQPDRLRIYPRGLKSHEQQGVGVEEIALHRLSSASSSAP